MSQITFKEAKRVLLYVAAGFVLLFVLRLINGQPTEADGSSDRFQSFEFSNGIRRNYASKEYKMKEHSAPSPVRVDQKFEKIAEINTRTSAFEKDELHVRKQIEGVNALIQFEQKGGNTGHRSLHLVIGVPPENFDSLYNVLIKVGKVQAKRITKNDKTNEYRELNAKKASLEKTRASLIELKTKGGKIDEYMSLENRILEIEQQLQDLGVSLGDFDTENEFCTVKFSLTEVKEKNVGMGDRLLSAFAWTVKTYCIVLVGLCLATLFSYLLLLSIDKTKGLMKKGE